MADLIKLASAGTIAALLSATPALAQVYTDWDSDADGALTMEEFREGFTARLGLADWDTDGDGLLSEEEFGGGVFSRYDLDATDAIEEAEYEAVEEDFGTEGVWRFRGEELVADPDELAEGVADEGVVETEVAEEDVADEELVLGAETFALEGWDVDGDGVLLRNEFEEGFTRWGTFGEFDVDADGFISQDELSDGVFTRYDDDLDGIIEEPELTDIGDDMGDEGFWDV